MAFRNGVVIQSDGKEILLQVSPLSFCTNKECALCPLGKPIKYRVKLVSGTCSKGDEVKVVIPESQIISRSVWVYGIPVFSFVAGAVGGSLAGLNELGSFLSAVGLLVISGIFAHLCSGKKVMTVELRKNGKVVAQGFIVETVG